jgi:hypothetical protein
VRTVLLGVLLGAVVVFDPLVTTYLLRDFSWLHGLPYLLSVTAALTVGAAFAGRRYAERFAATVIYDYSRYFPLLFLLAYQFTGVKAGPVDPTEVLIGIFIMLFLAGLFIHRDQRFVSSPFNVLHVALAICFAVSLISAFRPFYFLKGLKPFIVFFLLVNFLPRDNLIQTFLRWLLVLAMLSAVFALVQEIAWATTQTMVSLLPEKELKLMFEEHFGIPIFRPPAMMASYRVFAMYLATALVLSVSALLWRKEEAPLLRPRWLVLGLCVIVPALVLTLAKDIAIGYIAGLALLLVMRRPTRYVPAMLLAGLAGALVILTVIAIVPGNVDTALDHSRTVPRSEQERFRLDRDSIEGFLHGPYFWTGRGIGSAYKYTAHSRRWPAHNAFILAAAELGVAGLTIYLAIYGLVIARVVALNIVVTSGPYLPVVRSLLPIMVVVLAGAQFEASYLDVFIWTIFAVAEGIWFQVRRQAVVTTEPLANNDTGYT